jgi:hypothetical protein
MTISNREKYFTIALIVACATFVLDRLAIGPYLDRRSALVQQRQDVSAHLTEARQVLRDERRLSREMAGMQAFFRLDASAAEGRLLRLLQESEQAAGVSGASFQRVGIVDEHGFTRLSFQATVIGKMTSVAGFLYKIETASLPLRVDDVQVAPKLEGGEELQVHFILSTLCRAKPAPKSHPEPAADIALLDAKGDR